MIIDKISNKLGICICSNCSTSKSDEEKVIYALNAILGEIVKLTILIIIFLILHKVKFFIFSVSILMSVRIFAGGIHLKKFAPCLLFSIFVFAITSLISPILPRLHNQIYYIVAILNILLISIRSPCPNKKRPIKNFNRLLYLKVSSIFFTILWLGILFFYINDISLFNCGLSTITIQSVQLLLANKEGGLL